MTFDQSHEHIAVTWLYFKSRKAHLSVHYPDKAHFSYREEERRDRTRSRAHLGRQIGSTRVAGVGIHSRQCEMVSWSTSSSDSVTESALKHL